MNGSRGIVVGFVDATEVKVVQMEDGKSYATGHKLNNSEAVEIALPKQKSQIFKDKYGKPLPVTLVGVNPVVSFACGVTMVLPPFPFSVESPIGEIEASRIQVPLILAWACSVHKVSNNEERSERRS